VFLVAIIPTTWAVRRTLCPTSALKQFDSRRTGDVVAYCTIGDAIGIGQCTNIVDHFDLVHRKRHFRQHPLRTPGLNVVYPVQVTEAVISWAAAISSFAVSGKEAGTAAWDALTPLQKRIFQDDVSVLQSRITADMTVQGVGCFVIAILCSLMGVWQCFVLLRNARLWRERLANTSQQVTMKGMGCSALVPTMEYLRVPGTLRGSAWDEFRLWLWSALCRQPIALQQSTVTTNGQTVAMQQSVVSSLPTQLPIQAPA
jgi:hypothetical protein